MEVFGADSIRAALRYLDDGALAWTRERSCMACHTTGVYMSERPALTILLGVPLEQVRASFVSAVPSEPGVDPGRQQPHGFAVWRALGLAQWDKHVTRTLSEPTKRALRDMLLRLPDEGLYHTVGKVEIPYTTTGFELTVQAARALAAFPEWPHDTDDAELRKRVVRLRTALSKHEPRNDYERALQLQLAAVTPDLIAPEIREAAIAMLWEKQHPDGGWSTRDMSAIENWGDQIRPDTVAMLRGEPDVGDPASDSYMTAFAIILLRENGVPSEDPRLQHSIAWLKGNQRASGRWWMKSLYKPTQHFSTYIATAHAMRALALCGEIPSVLDNTQR